MLGPLSLEGFLHKMVSDAANYYKGLLRIGCLLLVVVNSILNLRKARTQRDARNVTRHMVVL